MDNENNIANINEEVNTNSAETIQNFVDSLSSEDLTHLNEDDRNQILMNILMKKNKINILIYHHRIDIF